MACPRCGTHNRAGVAFCQNCGANLRGTAPGYVPPAVAGPPPAHRPRAERRGAVLGPVVLLIGMVGLITGYLLPFAYGTGSLYERAFGARRLRHRVLDRVPPDEGRLADTGVLRPRGTGADPGRAPRHPRRRRLRPRRPGTLQTHGLVVALAWSVGLIVLFVVVEVVGNWSGDIVDVLRAAHAGGIILFLASLIVVIGTLTGSAGAERARFCPNCGTEVDETPRFCPTCGQPIDQAG